MSRPCSVSPEPLARVLSLVEARDPEAVRAAAGLGSPLGPELSLAASEAIAPAGRRGGAFIVVTGIDKAGKETQVFNPARLPGVRALLEFVEGLGYGTMGVRQPEYDFLSGQLIRSYLGLDSGCSISGRLPRGSAWVLWSLNRALLNRPVAAWLSGDGRAVVSKRWGESNLAYHAPQGVSPERILSLERGFVQPDLFVVLDLDPEVSARRAGGAGDAFESRLRLLSAAREILRDLGRYFPDSEVAVVDASADPASVNGAVLDAVRSFLRRRARGRPRRWPRTSRGRIRRGLTWRRRRHPPAPPAVSRRGRTPKPAWGRPS
ncbi:MAG: dTMP kinase [Conexivisphaera sp.]